MTTRLVCGGEVICFERLLLVEKPISVICAPLRGIAYRKCALEFTDPSGQGAPLRSSLEPPQLFADGSFGLIQKLVGLGADLHSRRIFLKKKAEFSGRHYWRAECDAEFKSCPAPAEIPRRAPPSTSVGAMKSGRSQNEPLDAPMAPVTSPMQRLPPNARIQLWKRIRVSIREMAVRAILAFWLSEDDWVSRPDQPRDLGTADVIERIPAREIYLSNGILAGVVDESKYYITVSSLASLLTVRWKRSDRGSHWDRFARSKAQIDAKGGKKSHSSSSSPISIHSHAVCVARDRRWCAWNSSWIYDVRPAGRV